MMIGVFIYCFWAMFSVGYWNVVENIRKQPRKFIKHSKTFHKTLKKH
jgi:hypothetical protein